MNWWKIIDPIFPVIEPLTPAEARARREALERDLGAINAATWSTHDDRALDEAQRVAIGEAERVKSAESKATTCLAVLAALVPLILTLQAANWEEKSGPAPEGLKLLLLGVATIYVAAAGYHAFRAQQVSGFQRVSEADLAAAWESRNPLRRLTSATLLASRRSRNTVNEKITRVRATHAHLLRAFAVFVLLLLLDPIFYAFGARGHPEPEAQMSSVVVEERLVAPSPVSVPSPASLPPVAASLPSSAPASDEPTVAASPEPQGHREQEQSAAEGR